VFGTTLTKLRNRMGTSTLGSLAELKMHIRDEHKDKSTKIRMKNLFSHRSPSDAAPPLSPPSPSIPIPGPTITPLTWTACESPTLSTLQHLIPDDIADDEPSPATASGSIFLTGLFNFDKKDWVSRYDGYAKQHLAEELNLCELLNQDAATDEGAEVDVDEMTGDILMG
jgi:hypothetical protein